MKARLLKALRRSRSADTDGCRKIHFLHIGKTAGTQFELLADHLNSSQSAFRIIKENHNTDLTQLKIGVPYLFSVRAPHARFKSGFYSRKRQGRPRYDNPWGPYEAAAFDWFDHANDLAEALFEDGSQGFRAMCALQSIGHCAKQQIQWFNKCGTMFDINPPLAILRQEHFEADMNRFLQGMGVDPDQITLTDDAEQAHKTDYSDIPPLSDLALVKLRQWYAPDYEFYRWCNDWVEQRGKTAAQSA